MKTVLIIEDDEGAISDYLEALEGLVEVIVARSHKQAGRALRDKTPDRAGIDIIVLDGLVPFWDDGRDIRRTDPLVEHAFHYLEVPPLIIAASSDDKINKELVALGCQHFISRKDVYRLRTLIVSIIDTTP